MSMKEKGLEPVGLSGGKRTNIGWHGSEESTIYNPEPDSDWDWWVGCGKDQNCQFEGPWQAMAILAAKILRHPNTAKVCPNLHVVLPLTDEQESNY